MASDLDLEPVRAALDSAEAVDPAPGHAASAPARPAPAPPSDARPNDTSPPSETGIGDSRFGAPDGPAVPDEVLERCAAFELNDKGNGMRLIEYFGQDVIYIPRVGWHVFTGQRWQVDPDGLSVQRIAHGVGPMIKREADFLSLSPEQYSIMEAARDETDTREALEALPRNEISAEDRQRLRLMQRRALQAAGLRKMIAQLKKSHRGFAVGSGNTAKIKNLMSEAAVYLRREVADMDSDPLSLNLENCTLQFIAREWSNDGRAQIDWDVEARPHDRRDLISKMMAVSYDAEARCPVFDAFLKFIQPKQEMRDFLQRWFGYSILGYSREQKFVFFYGEGKNGKSTLTNLIERLMGDYAASISIETLTGSDERRSDAATPDLIGLPGARMVNTAEPKEGARLKEAEIKRLTGGETIRARRLQHEFFEFVPIFSITASGNHKPEVHGGDFAIWRRILLVLFEQVIADGDTDRDLPEKLWSERSGILNWLITGAVDYLENGLASPPEVLSATEDYKSESDPVEMFLGLCCDITGDAEDVVRAKRMSDAFQFWQREGGVPPWQGRKFATRMIEKARKSEKTGGPAFSHERTSKTTEYRGIRLKSDFAAEMDMGHRD